MSDSIKIIADNRKASFDYFLEDRYEAGLVLTGIVVSVSVTAIMLALSIRLYKKYHTLDLDKIFMYEKKHHDAEM